MAGSVLRQGAVAAGLLGVGSTFVGSAEGCAEHLARIAAASDPRAEALAIARAHQRLPGFGHPLHKPVDPRSTRLFEIGRETGFYGKYCVLMEAIAKEKKLTLNATGAIGALACELGLDWKVVKGLGVMARAIGLVGHILEESRMPLAEEVWHRVEEESTRHIEK